MNEHVIRFYKHKAENLTGKDHILWFGFWYTECHNPEKHMPARRIDGQARSVPQAIKYIHSLDMGKAYDKTLLLVARAFNRGGAAMVLSLLRTPELYGDPCAAALRECLKMEGDKGGSRVFSFCQSKRGGGAASWVKDHGWRVKKWTSFTPYIHPTATKE